MKKKFTLLILLVLLLAACTTSQPGAATAVTSPITTPRANHTPTSMTLPIASPTATPYLTATPATLADMPLCQVDGPEVYLVSQGVRHHVIDMDTFLNLGLEEEHITPCGEMAAYPLSISLTRLLKGSGDPVYWMEQGQRHHIPDMATFYALGHKEENIAEIPDELLDFWPLGEALPSSPPPTVAVLTSPSASATAPPGASSERTLQQKLLAIHDQFEFDPAAGCFALRSPEVEYLRGLEQMTALLVADPLAQSLSLRERASLFKEITGFAPTFYPGGSEAMLVSLPSNRGYNLACGSHHQAPDVFHVVDEQGTIWPIRPPAAGLSVAHWWIEDRWAVLLRLKLDSSSGPTGWALFQVGQEGGQWKPMLYYPFTPAPYNDYGKVPQLRFEEGYQHMVAELAYWQYTDPCLLDESFRAAYEHSTWNATEHYAMQGDTYVRTDFQPRDVLVYDKEAYHEGSAEAVNVDWQRYCIGPLQPQEWVR